MPDSMPAAIGALAAAIAQVLSESELTLLAAVLTQLGDSLTVILAQRACLAPDKGAGTQSGAQAVVSGGPV